MLAVALTACGSDAKQSSATALSFDIADSGCDPATATGVAGEVTLAVKNSTDSRAEFEIVTPAPQIALEKFLEAGKSDTYKLTLPAADYVLICGSPLNDKGKLTLTGSGGTGASVTGSSVDPTALAEAVTDYTAYVSAEVVKLQTSVSACTDAVRSGDNDQAKALYAARTPAGRSVPATCSGSRTGRPTRRLPTRS